MAMKLEIRSDNSVRLTGYVNVTGRDSRPIPSPHGSFIEQVVPGTFKKALSANPNVEMRFNHGRKVCDQENGLTLREDDIGLYADATFYDEEIAEKGRRNELRGWSFGFHVKSDHWDDSGKRYLDDIDLREVSVLDKTPAYIATSVEMRDGEYVEYRDGGESAGETTDPPEVDDSGGSESDTTETGDQTPDDTEAGESGSGDDNQDDQQLEDAVVQAKALYNYLKFKMKYKEYTNESFT